MKFSRLQSGLLGGAVCLTIPAQASAFSYHADHVLGTSLDVAIVAASEMLADFAMQAIHSEIARLDAILSGWRLDSELAALNAAPVHSASPDLFAVIAAGETWRQKTEGAFSLRLGRLAAASREDTAALAAAINRAHLSVDPQTREIRRPDTVRFAVDGLAKGYIVDQAMAAAMRMPGIQGLMIDIGGDLRCWGQPPDGTGWKIGVMDGARSADNAPPATVLNLTSGAVATSGKGARRDTIWNPDTGFARDGVILATAIAPTATDADALATALYVLPPHKGIALVDSLPATAARIAAADGSTHVSSRWNAMQVAQNAVARPNAISAWPPGFALKIDYEIPMITGGRRIRPPYVAIWISDERGTPVRTLAFYANKARYMPESYIFWENVAGNNKSMLDTITRPTRPPGTYSLEWDGRDDTGRLMPQGRYTVNLEATREHGGHNIQRIAINLGTAPSRASAPPQAEIGAVQVTYGR